MLSDQHNSTMAKAMRLIFSLLDVTSAQEVPFGIYNTFFMDLSVPSFVFHSSLLTAKSVDSVVVHDGFLFISGNFLTGYFDYTVSQ